ncbi:hypothetical protein [Streptomyces mirabilis]|uniref:hypothetical protein n=1 Tax=Streptomyces mirabilis TaxID=68239 RepID=UPI00369D4134
MRLPTYDDLAFYSGCIWMVAITSLVIKTRLEQRKAQVQKAYAPLPVDPANPPVPGIFASDPEDPKVLCDCHGRPIADGQAIVCWPQPPKFTCDNADKGPVK